MGIIEFTNPVQIITSKKMPMVMPFMQKSLFTDNASVVYKSHSLASGGTGSVVNSRRKARRT